MIPVESLVEKDVMRRLIWETVPGVEQEAYLLSWLVQRNVIIIALPMPNNMCKPVEVAPEQVRWAESSLRRRVG